MRKPIPTIAETRQLVPFSYLALENIVVPVTADEFESARLHIIAAKVVGFDTESKPVIEKGAINNGPHVIQFAVHDRAYIFQLSNPESYNPLLFLLASENIQKIGFDLGSDRKLIRKKFGILPRGFFDLCPVLRKQGYKGSIGIRAAVAILFNKQFHKPRNVTMSNWSNPTLSDSQLKYAANDAYGALIVYLQLCID